MKKHLRNILLLLAPYLLMVAVNEYIRPTISEKPYIRFELAAINSAIRTPEKCSWNCHNDTQYCRKHHTEVLKPYFEYLDPIYFGMIRLLHKTGNYGIANIVFLVTLWPLLMYFLLIRCLDMFTELRSLKNNKTN